MLGDKEMTKDLSYRLNNLLATPVDDLDDIIEAYEFKYGEMPFKDEDFETNKILLKRYRKNLDILTNKKSGQLCMKNYHQKELEKNFQEAQQSFDRSLYEVVDNENADVSIIEILITELPSFLRTVDEDSYNLIKFRAKEVKKISLNEIIRRNGMQEAHIYLEVKNVEKPEALMILDKLSWKYKLTRNKNLQDELTLEQLISKWRHIADLNILRSTSSQIKDYLRPRLSKVLLFDHSKINILTRVHMLSGLNSTRKINDQKLGEIKRLLCKVVLKIYNLL